MRVFGWLVFLGLAVFFLLGRGWLLDALTRVGIPVPYWGYLVYSSLWLLFVAVFLMRNVPDLIAAVKETEGRGILRRPWREELGRWLESARAHRAHLTFLGILAMLVFFFTPLHHLLAYFGFELPAHGRARVIDGWAAVFFISLVWVVVRLTNHVRSLSPVPPSTFVQAEGKTFELTVFPFHDLGKIRWNLQKMAKPSGFDAVTMVDYLLVQALGARASDIHVDPFQDHVAIRYRIDGALTDLARVPKSVHEQLIGRLKVLSNLMIYQKRVPQDGRLKCRIGDREQDFRTSVLPTLHGEKAVLRALHLVGEMLDLDQLGMDTDMLREYKSLLSRPQGTIVVTGPAGAGKTTTMYASLKWTARSKESAGSIVTLEDPIERDLGEFTQTQVQPQAGFTFARGLRTALRQDPDVIMVGEIRDSETAEIAIEAGLTGHLVITTVHADRAPGVVTRLIDMGIRPFLVASSLSAVISQRLIRRLCAHCKTRARPPDYLLERISYQIQEGDEFAAPRGCPKCGEKGYLGRTGLFELMVLTPALQERILERVPTNLLLKCAVEQGFVSLLDDGMKKARAGITSLEEVLRVLEERR